MAETWTTLYNNALQSDPAQLLETIKIACHAMHARLYALGSHDELHSRSERRAIYLGLADLQVLRKAYHASQDASR